jgi:hypothetical protein
VHCSSDLLYLSAKVAVLIFVNQLLICQSATKSVKNISVSTVVVDGKDIAVGQATC